MSDSVRQGVGEHAENLAGELFAKVLILLAVGSPLGSAIRFFRRLSKYFHCIHRFAAPSGALGLLIACANEKRRGFHGAR